jgi:hypothetical protein
MYSIQLILSMAVGIYSANQKFWYNVSTAYDMMKHWINIQQTSLSLKS